MKARNREEFVKCWEEEFDVLAMLSESLPTAGKLNIAIEYLNKLRELRLRYIALAANDTFGARLCRYCEHMKDGANGEAGPMAPGSYCALDLVKQEAGDLTAATCKEFKRFLDICGDCLRVKWCDNKVKHEIVSCTAKVREQISEEEHPGPAEERNIYTNNPFGNKPQEP